MRHRAFPGRGPEVDARYQRAGQWLSAAIYGDEKAQSWCKSNNVPLIKAASENINSSGGFVVPTELSNAILDLRDMYGAFRRRARIVPMASDRTTIARRPGGTVATFVGENSTTTATTLSVDAVDLTARKITSMVLLSHELEEDAVADAVDFVANEIAFAFASKEDDCAFNGDGTSAYGTMYGLTKIIIDGNHGKANVAAASGHNTFATLDTTDLGKLMGSIRGSALANAAWFCSQAAFANTFCRLSGGTAGGYLYTDVVDGINTPFYLGFPVIITQKMPVSTSSLASSVMIAFGDMYAAGLLGQRRGITLARSSDRYMDLDQIAVLGTERFHSVIHDVGDGTNFGSIAGLVGTS